MTGRVSITPFASKAADLQAEGFKEGASSLGDYAISGVARDLRCAACGAPGPTARVFRRGDGEAPDNKLIFTICGFCDAWEQHGPGVPHEEEARRS